LFFFVLDRKKQYRAAKRNGADIVNGTTATWLNART